MNNYLIIGNGPSVIDEPYGRVIDEFDGKVVRFNDFVLEPVEYTGTKTDIWIVNRCYRPDNEKGGHKQFDYKALCARHPNLASKIKRVPIRDQYNVRKLNVWFRSSGVATMCWLMKENFVVLHGFDHFKNGSEHYYSNEGRYKEWYKGGQSHRRDSQIVRAGIDSGRVCRLNQLIGGK